MGCIWHFIHSEICTSSAKRKCDFLVYHRVVSLGPWAKEKYADIGFSIFPAHAKMGPDGPKWGQEDFFPTNPDLADILGRTDLDFEIFLFWDFCWIPNFQISRFQISKFPGSQIHKIPDFQVPRFPDSQTPPAPLLAPPDELSNADPGPSQRTQG